MEKSEFKGKLTAEETEFIQKLYQRKMALLELMPTIKTPMDKESLDYIYEKIVNDLQETNQKMHKWWLDVSNSHGWKYGDGDMWSVNFKDREVSIKSADKGRNTVDKQ